MTVILNSLSGKSLISVSIFSPLMFYIVLSFETHFCFFILLDCVGFYTANEKNTSVLKKWPNIGDDACCSTVPQLLVFSQPFMLVQVAIIFLIIPST